MASNPNAPFNFDGVGNLLVTGGTILDGQSGGSVVDIAAEASLAAIQAATGTQADGAWSGSGNSTLIAALKAIIARLDTNTAGSWQIVQPVSGTVTANVGSGTQAVSGTVTANAGSGTLAVSAAALPLPAGAATAAKQAAFGTAGTASADVLSVQGIASGTALRVAQAGGTPVDYSNAAPTVPIGGMVLLATVPATATRAAVEVQNQSAATIQVVRDDGAAGAGTVSSVLLAAGTGAGEPGARWASATFKGRVRVYGANGAQVSVFQE